MNDDLVKRLRDAAKMSDALALLLPHSEGNAMAKLYNEAAAAIEELSKQHEQQRKNLIALMNEKPRWISVEQRLPEKNQIVVAVESGRTWDYGQFRGLAYRGGDKRKWNWKNNTTKTVDYWMLKKDALPEPPKEESYGV